MNNSEIKFKSSDFLIPFGFVFLLWFIYFIEIKFNLNFNKLGVYPRTFFGLKGVFFTHFIHSNASHLFNNSIPLLVLFISLMTFYRQVAFKTIIYGSLITGFLTWSIARESYHIGASGVVYLLFSFVFFSGIIKKNYRLVALSLIIIFLYGSMIWYVLPIKEGMSWEGHLSGFLTGIYFAFIYRNKGLVKEEYVFEQTDFDTMFDEDGNLIETSFDDEVFDEEL